MTRRSRWRTAALLALVVLAAGCSSSAIRREATPDSAKVAADAVPATLLGLTTQPEDVKGPLEKAGDSSYASDVRLWSLREGDRLRATLEIGRFSPDAPITEAFRSKVAAQVGQAAPRLRRIGRELVYVSAGNRQVFYLWYRGAQFVLLGVPADTTIGRSLARSAIDEVHP